MSKSAVYISNFKVLYNIIFEIKNFFNFDIFEFQSEKSILDEQKKRESNSFIIITKDKFSSKTINNKQVIIIEGLPLNLISLVETINSNLLMQQFNFQSNIIIKNYKLDLNSRQISNQNKKLKLTEREIQIVLFLKKQKKPININTLQKEVCLLSKRPDRIENCRCSRSKRFDQIGSRYFLCCFFNWALADLASLACSILPITSALCSRTVRI